MKKLTIAVIAFALALVARPAHAQWHQVVTGDTFQLQDQGSTSPLKTGQFGLWRNGNALNLQLSSGTIISIGAGFSGAIVANTTFLTSTLASNMPRYGVVVVQSTGGGFITYDNVNWTALW